MSHVRFDPSKAVTFDLSRGLVHLEGAPARLLVPAEALGALAAAAGAEATRAFGRSLGEALGRRAADRLAAGDGLRGATADAVLEHLGGELALAGLGSLSLERWGRALVLVVDQSPLAAAGDTLLEAVLSGAFEAASGKAVHVLVLARDSVRARFLLTGSAGAEKVRTWLAEGLSWGEALVRLHAGASVAGGAPSDAGRSEEPAAEAKGAPEPPVAGAGDDGADSWEAAAAAAPPRGDA